MTEARPGDWLCLECNFSNYSTRKECKECRYPRPAGIGADGPEGGRGCVPPAPPPPPPSPYVYKCICSDVPPSSRRGGGVGVFLKPPLVERSRGPAADSAGFSELNRRRSREVLSPAG